MAFDRKFNLYPEYETCNIMLTKITTEILHKNELPFRNKFVGKCKLL